MLRTTCRVAEEYEILLPHMESFIRRFHPDVGYSYDAGCVTLSSEHHIDIQLRRIFMSAAANVRLGRNARAGRDQIMTLLLQ